MGLEVKIGKAQRLGPFELWPLKVTGISKSQYVTPPMGEALSFNELEGEIGPTVSQIKVTNRTNNDFFLPSGWIVGAELLQVRTFNNAEFVPAGGSIIADVSCVERGRWSAGIARTDGGRAPISVLVAGWHFQPSTNAWEIDTFSRQAEVWKQISRKEMRSGIRPTHSLEQIMHEDLTTDTYLAQISAEIQNDLQIFESQNGVVISCQAQPLLMEFYSAENALRSVLSETLRALVFDIWNRDFIPCQKSEIESFVKDSLLDHKIRRGKSFRSISLALPNEQIEAKATFDATKKIMQFMAINRSHQIFTEV